MTRQEQIILLLDFLKLRLKNKLPGIEAHKLMAPVRDGNYFRSFDPSQTASLSAVLTLLTMKNDALNILFTLRSKKIKHSGQISFPGGRSENGESPEQTALRETREEIGIGPDEINILGRLSSLYVPPSDTVIIPVLAYKERVNGININDDEVEEAFFVPFEKFTDMDSRTSKIWDFNGEKVSVPCWDIHPAIPLWGATAMILMELLTIHNEFINN